MDKEELIIRLDASMNLQMVVNLTAIIESNNLDVNDLLEITFHKKKEIAFRSAWMLEYIVLHQPLKFYDHVKAFLLRLPKQKNPSAIRHYAKIVVLLTEKKSSLLYKEALSTVKMEPVIEVLFTWLIDPDTLVASKVHCMQALANLVPHYKWIKDELTDTIDHLMDIESIAFFARAKMVKKQLKKPE